MKTISRKFVYAGENRKLKIRNTVGKGMLVIMAIMCCINTNAQVSKTVITINSTHLTTPLIERWISEYSKLNPSQSFKILHNGETSDKADLNAAVYSNVTENAGKSQVKVGRFAILPIVNEKNVSFAKEFKKGVKSDDLKQIFLKNDSETSDSEKNKTKEPEYTVYTKTPQSGLAIAISSFLGRSADDLNGVYVTGDDKYLINSVLEDSTGVTYNNLGLIYDLSKRTVINGIKVLPIDLNGNGKLDKEELIYDNIDQVLTYIESSKKASIPTEYVSFTSDRKSSNPEVQNFINWVKEYGQEYNHQYGFLNVGSSQNLSLTQE